MDPSTHVDATAAPSDFSPATPYPSSVGVYLAVNAVRDLHLLVDGPSCAEGKAQLVQGNHDFRSDLIGLPGETRLASTRVDPWKVIAPREGRLAEELQALAVRPGVGALLVSALPMALVTGVDYGRLCHRVTAETGTPALLVPQRSLSGDWLDGYAEVLDTLAAGLPLDGGPKAPERVAIVGYLHDRNEADHTANAAELERLLGGLGLELTSVWLGGGSTADLARAGTAGTIVALPYGRTAAQRLAARSGARLVEAELPLGFAATVRFLARLAAPLGRLEAATALVRDELAHAIPAIAWATAALLGGRTLGWVGDPFLYEGFVELAATLGARVGLAVVTNRARRMPTVPALELPEPLRTWAGDAAAVARPTPLVAPTQRGLEQALAAARGELDLLVTNSLGLLALPPGGPPTVELGFPSFFHHALFERPFLGFRGAVGLIDAFANALRGAEAERARAGRSA